MTGWEVALTKLARLIPGWASSGWTVIERRRLANVAMDLAYLAFWNNGMLTPIKRIADGDDEPSNLDEIAAQLQETDAGVSAAAARLYEARDKLVATALGMPIARQLDQVVWQKLGPGRIRPKLEELARTKACTRDDAKELLKEIDAFNNHLDAVHTAILQTRTAARSVKRATGRAAPKKGARAST